MKLYHFRLDFSLSQLKILSLLFVLPLRSIFTSVTMWWFGLWYVDFTYSTPSRTIEEMMINTTNSWTDLASEENMAPKTWRHQKLEKKFWKSLQHPLTKRSWLQFFLMKIIFSNIVTPTAGVIPYGKPEHWTVFRFMGSFGNIVI